MRALPEGGKANAALTTFLARTLRVPRSNIEIASGARAKLKMIRVAGDPATFGVKLGHLGGGA